MIWILTSREILWNKILFDKFLHKNLLGEIQRKKSCNLVEMKPSAVVLFMSLVFVALGVLGWVIPEEGVKMGSAVLRFPSPSSLLAENDNNAPIDVDSTLIRLQRSSEIGDVQTTLDSLKFYKQFFLGNEARIFFPNNDYTYWDPLFELLRKSSVSRIFRVMHYGDSQIEMDRISSTIRQNLQERVGGMGPGILPPVQTIPTFTVIQSATGMHRYVCYGDSSQPRAPHRRYGLMATCAQVNGSATFSARASAGKRAQPLAKKFQKVTLLVGNNSANFSATCKGVTKSLPNAIKGVSLLQWDFKDTLSNVSITLNGTADVYGVALEGRTGASVSNVPMRGCSGTIFTRIDSAVLGQCYRKAGVDLIIMQYGGNMMPSISSDKAVSNYMTMISKQLKYIHTLYPHAKILFIGPSDMSKRVNGKLQSYPYLAKMNESLKQTVLANDAAYWDMFHVMGGENSMIQWVNHSPAWAGPDYVHFTETGAAEIARILSNAFLTYYDFYLLRSRCNSALVHQFMIRGE